MSLYGLGILKERGSLGTGATVWCIGFFFGVVFDNFDLFEDGFFLPLLLDGAIFFGGDDNEVFSSLLSSSCLPKEVT